MKKKRSEKHIIKRRDDSNKRTIPSDKHHSAHTPCCDLITEVVTEIFPQADADTDDKVDDKNDGVVGKNAKSDNPPQPEVKEQPLLGYMIRKYLIEQHQKNRGNANASSSSNSSKQQTNASKNGSEAGTSKSSKKKKKKKKASSSNGNVATESADVKTNGDSAGSALDEHESANDGLNNAVNYSAQNNEAKTHGNNNENQALHTLPSGLDCFLDSIIMQTDPLQGTDNTTRTNRDLQSFATYLARKYEYCIETQRNPQKHKKKDSHNNTSEVDLISILPTVALDEMKLHASNIECRRCQTTVNAEMKNLLLSLHPTNNVLPWGMHDVSDYCSKERSFVLDDQSVVLKRRHQPHSLAVPISTLDDDRAFDYMHMDDHFDLESGHLDAAAGKSPSVFRLVFHPISSTPEGTVQFMQIKAVSNTQDDKEHYPLTLYSIINLIKSVVLPCGLELKDPIAPDNQLTDSEYEAIADSARDLSAQHQMKFYQINNLMKQTRSTYEESVASNTSRSTYDSKTPQTLNSCNEFCQFVLKSTGEFMASITKMACVVGWTSQYGPHVMECMMDCWDQFNVTLNKLIQPTMNYRGFVLSSFNRPGQVPLLYSNKIYRDRYLEYLGVKVAIIEKLVSFMEERLINPNLKSYRGQEHQAPSPLARLCVLNAFMSHLYRSQNRLAPSIFSSVDDEGEFNKLLEARVMLSQNVIKSPTKQNIEAKEKENFSEVRTLYASIAQTVLIKDLEYKNSPEFIKNWYDRVALERERAEQEFKSEPEQYTPELIASSMNTSQLLTMQWIYMLCMRQSFMPIDFVLPKRLDDWMESISGSEIKLAKPIKEDIPRCEGTGAKRRVSSIFSVLLYRWLETRCSEWHAELTQNELLTSVDVDEPVVKEGATKSSKKKKAKKKTGGEKVSMTQNGIPTQLSHSQPKNNNDDSLESLKSNGVPHTNSRENNKDEIQPSSPIAIDEDIHISAEQTISTSAKAEICDKQVEVEKSAAAQASVKNETTSNASKNKNKATKPAVKDKQAASKADQPKSRQNHVHTVKPDNHTKGGEYTKVQSSNSSDKSKEAKHVTSTNAFKNISKTATAQSIADPQPSENDEPLSKKQPKNVVNAAVTTQQPPSAQSHKRLAPMQSNEVSDSSRNTNFTSKSAKKEPRQTSKVAKQVHPQSKMSDKSLPQKQLNNVSNNVKSSNASAKQISPVKSIDNPPTQTPEKSHSLNDAIHSNQRPQAIQQTATTANNTNVTLDENQHSAINIPDGDEIRTTKLQTSIGVIDNHGKVISAQDFLVGRMEALLAEIEEVKSRYTLWF